MYSTFLKIAKTLNDEGTIVALFKDGNSVKELSDEGDIVFEKATDGGYASEGNIAYADVAIAGESGKTEYTVTVDAPALESGATVIIDKPEDIFDYI